MTEPIPAATVVLTRPAPKGSPGLEVLLTRRPSSMAFAPDMQVFPGGRVDADDADPRLAVRCATSAIEAAARMGGDLAPEVALAAHVAAIREAFEEVGVLLADAGEEWDGEPASATVAPAADLARARAAMLAGDDTFAAIIERFDLRLRTDRLVPLSRWVTPPVLPRRFDARFFVAAAPAGIEVSLLGDEVADHGWHTPRGALDALASGRLGMWAPTSATLQQLEHAASMAEVEAHLASGELGSVGVDEVARDVLRIEMPAGGGIAGQPVFAYLVGRARLVVVDPGDPTGPGLERLLEVVASRGATIVAVALTHADPDHCGAAEGLAEQLHVPVYAGPGAGRDLPFDPTEVGEGTRIEEGDVPLEVVETPGPRPDHVALVVGAGPTAAVLAGDLGGVRGARTVPAPRDEVAWARSVARLRSVAPGTPWFGGHPEPGTGS